MNSRTPIRSNTAFSKSFTSAVPIAASLLIGDPKQAIYAFRGADIFTYMRARSEVSAHYTLETNWRSSPSMVASVNHLFSPGRKSLPVRPNPLYRGQRGGKEPRVGV